MQRICLVILLFISIWSQGQSYLKPNEYHFLLFNKLDVFLINAPTDTRLTLNLTIRAGSFAEADSTWGAVLAYHTIFFTKLKQDMESVGASVSEKIGNDGISYIITNQVGTLEKTLSRLTESLSNAAPLPSSGVYSLPIDTSSSDYLHIRKQLWGNYYSRVTSIPDSLSDAAKQMVPKVHGLFYNADNAILVIRGNVSSREVYNIIQTTIAGWQKGRFGYFSKYPVPFPNDLGYKSQIVLEQPTGLPTFLIQFKGAAYRNDKQLPLAGALLMEVANNAASVKKFADSSHISSLRLETQQLPYASDITLRIEVKPEKADSAYHSVFKILQHLREGKLFTASELEIAKEKMLQQFKTDMANPLTNTQLVAQSWLNSTIDDYDRYEERLKSLTIEDLCGFAQHFMYHKNFITGLIITQADRKTYQTDTFFTDTYPIESYRFYFLKNTGNAAANTNQDSLIQSLAQLLKINPQIKLVVSGVAEKNELLQVSDEQMVKFIEEHPGFTITPGSLIPSKKIRLDVYRALKIVKALVEKGVDEKQLVGTGGLIEPGEKAPDLGFQVYCTYSYF
ncbi:MAG: hypothetical protein SFW35_02420 [Chitinophagales bacterium]|nr:hypothetical protein [Chitinophagales bacterium]